MEGLSAAPHPPRGSLLSPKHRCLLQAAAGSRLSRSPLRRPALSPCPQRPSRPSTFPASSSAPSSPVVAHLLGASSLAGSEQAAGWFHCRWVQTGAVGRSPRRCCTAARELQAAGTDRLSNPGEEEKLPLLSRWRALEPSCLCMHREGAGILRRAGLGVSGGHEHRASRLPCQGEAPRAAREGSERCGATDSARLWSLAMAGPCWGKTAVLPGSGRGGCGRPLRQANPGVAAGSGACRGLAVPARLLWGGRFD